MKNIKIMIDNECVVDTTQTKSPQLEDSREKVYLTITVLNPDGKCPHFRVYNKDGLRSSRHRVWTAVISSVVRILLRYALSEGWTDTDWAKK